VDARTAEEVDRTREDGDGTGKLDGEGTNEPAEVEAATAAAASPSDGNALVILSGPPVAGSRYQLASGSPMQSPTRTSLYPYCLA
jgi:hypothetical protein